MAVAGIVSRRMSSEAPGQERAACRDLEGHFLGPLWIMASGAAVEGQLDLGFPTA